MSEFDNLPVRMSDLSEAERRKILRERRQQKFSNGGASSRLNKITGQVANNQLSTESPLDSAPVSKSTSSLEASSPPASSTSPVGNEASTEEMDQLIASISKPPSSRIPPKAKVAAPVNQKSPSQIETGNRDDPQLDIFKRLMETQQQDGSTPDLLSMFQSMNGSLGNDETPLPFAPEPVDQAMLEYHNYLVNQLKAWSIIIKWGFFLLPYVYLVTKPSASHPFMLPHWIVNPSNFFPVFLAFEIVCTAIFYQKLQFIEKNNKVNTLQNTSKIAKLVAFIPDHGLPISNVRGKVLMALQYWDVLSMFITDVCFVLIIMGAFTYM